MATDNWESMPPPRSYCILILINVRWWNATAFYAVNIARLLHRNGHRVWVGCDPGYPAYAMARRYGLQVAPLAFYGGHPLKLLRSFRRLMKLVRTQGIEIINSHRSEDHSFGLLAKFCCRTRLVITRGDQRRIQPHFLSRLRYRLADAVVLTCRQLLRDNAAVFDPIQKRVRVIYGSVDEDHFRPRTPTATIASRYAIPPDRILIGMIGRLSAVKDQARFITVAIALAHLRSDLHFLVAGKDVDLSREALQRRVAAAGVSSHFTFVGQVDDIAGLMQRIDIGVVNSITSETISRVLLEFMYLGKAVVATAVNAVGEIVIPGVTGERIPAGDGPALARAIIRLVDTPALRRDMARRAAETYQQHYSEAAFYGRYMELFGDLK
ncbi:MAG: glycosyltransferase family 4 protein [Desulfosarcinaceae bacterium]|nr:glycosyltransferase family 4 protein [Desulfosarcinaceae bacterium]